MRNPLKYDPARLATLRRAFSSDMRRRFRKLLKEIVTAIEQDTFDFANRELFTNAPKKAPKKKFKFTLDPAKLSRFTTWMKDKIRENVLSVDFKGDVWASKYIHSAYRKGAVRAYIDAHKADLFDTPDFYRGRMAQFLEHTFAQPERMSKIKLLLTRTYHNLQNISDDMSNRLAATLADGMAHGLGPVQTARNIKNLVYGIEKKRALVLARTESANAHAEGQLDSYEEMDIKEVGAIVEWLITDDTACNLCKDLNGKTFTIEEARGMLPRHPNCRCAWIPAFEDSKSR